MGSWEWVPETDELTWSENHFRLYGLEPNELEPTPELVVERTHPEDRERLRKEVERVQAGAPPRAVEFRIVWPNGEMRDLRSTIAEVESEPRRVIGYVQDITERRQAEREIQAHIAVADALGRWESLERSGKRLLQALGEAMEFVAGAVWLPQVEDLVARVFWQSGWIKEPELEHVVRGRRIPRDYGLAGRVWASRQPLSLMAIGADPTFEPEVPAPLADLRGALAFPALKGEEVLAILTFYSQQEFESSERVMQSMVGIGREVGHFLDRRRGELNAPVLTPRQLEVLQLAARGRNVPEIAEELVISRDTVKTHFRHIYANLDVNDRAAAVAQALRLGLIE
jgi:PAS domain S-box-containing protein